MDAQGRITEIPDKPATPESQVEVDRLREQLARQIEYWEKKNAAHPPPTESAIGDASTPQAIADASRKVAHLLLTRQIDATQGRTTLYALQVCLSALRVTEKHQPRAAEKHQPRSGATRKPGTSVPGKPKPQPESRKGRHRLATPKKKRGVKP